MGEDIHWPYFDTAAVLNPEVYELALTTLSPERILFGTDEPIFLWHGKRTWTKTGYQNLAREDFAWNTHSEGRKTEAGYTFYADETGSSTHLTLPTKREVRDHRWSWEITKKQ